MKTGLVLRDLFFIAKNLLIQNSLNDREKLLGWSGGSRLELFYDALDLL
jgi:hypothetical protein